jgi:aminoglycoside phosphotransferase (APT) family kinase protein
MEFADKDRAAQIVKEKYPDAVNTVFIEHGYDNLVALVDEKYVLRFPRNEHAYRRDRYEKEILGHLASLQEVHIPHIFAEEVDPPYFVSQFISGKHVYTDEIRASSVNFQKNIGAGIATFAYALHTSLPLEVAKKIREDFSMGALDEEPWEPYMEQMLLQRTLPTAVQDALAKKYFHLWKTKAVRPPTTAIHDDLHMDNMLFEHGQLAGVLDFADANVGTPEQEFRQLYRINDTVLGAAISAYENCSGQKLDIEISKIWAIAQELAGYSKECNNPTSKLYLRATSYLQQWLPEGEWGNI